MEPLLKKIALTAMLTFMIISLSWAEPTTQLITLGGVSFAPRVHQIQGKAYYSAQDPAVLSLIERSNVRFQWSGSGQTLFAFAPGRETYWNIDSKTCRVNGKDLLAPGNLVQLEGQTYLEPSALFYALALHGESTSDSILLRPVITQVTTDTDQGFLLRAASKMKPKVSYEGATTVFKVPDFCWDGSPELHLDKTTFRFTSGKTPDQPLEIRITPEPFVIAKLAGSTLLNETRISLQPNFPGSDDPQAVVLESLTSQANSDLLTLSFDRSTQIHYIYDTDHSTLKVLIPNATANVSKQNLQAWPDLNLTTRQTSTYPILEMEIPLTGTNWGFSTDESNPNAITLQRSLTNEVSALEPTGSIKTPGYANIRGTIVIDPGHGGSDPGCRNAALGLREADITLGIAKNLAQVLREQGWTVVLTRETDRDITYAGSPDMEELEARADVANKIGADLFMSIHCNASVNTGAAGTSIHWWKVEDYQFAQSLETVLGSTIGLGDKGLIRDRFVVLRHSQMPAVLVETAFLSNYAEALKLGDPKFQKVIAQQLAGGLASYMRGRYASRGSNHRVE